MRCIGGGLKEDGFRGLERCDKQYFIEDVWTRMRGRMVGGGWDLRMVGVKQDRMDILYCTLYKYPL
jgi:hypothetical protein